MEVSGEGGALVGATGHVPLVGPMGVVTSEVLFSEKQVKTQFNLSVHEQKPQLTNDKLKYLQWLVSWTTTLPQCITTLCILSCG